MIYQHKDSSWIYLREAVHTQVATHYVKLTLCFWPIQRPMITSSAVLYYCEKVYLLSKGLLFKAIHPPNTSIWRFAVSLGHWRLLLYVAHLSKNYYFISWQPIFTLYTQMDFAHAAQYTPIIILDLNLELHLTLEFWQRGNKSLKRLKIVLMWRINVG